MSAFVSISALAGVVFYTGGSAQRLTSAEDNIKKLDNTTIKKEEIQYRLDTIDKNVDEIKRELKEQRRK